MTFDSVIKGGRFIDPAAGRDEPLDIGVRNGKIAALARDLDTTDAGQVIDAAGKLVSPGFIDPHVHIYGGIGLNDPDSVGVHQGVTTICDFGGAGTQTFEYFRELTPPKAKTSVYSIVCVTAGGVGAYGFGTVDQMQIGRLDIRRFLRMVDENRDMIKGLKSMVSVVLGTEFLAMVKSLAYSAGIPFVLHLGEFNDYPDYRPGEYHEISGDILDALDDGDIITHCYTPEPGRIFKEDGSLLPNIQRAVGRGVLLDLGHSSHGFSIEVARLAVEQGYRPFTLGTDLHVSSVSPVMRSLADVMSKMFTLGFTLTDIVRMVTENPARALRIQHRAGTLKPGFPADVTVFELVPGEYEWMDSHRNHFSGTDRVAPLGCLKDGVWYPVRMDLVDTRENRNVAVWKEHTLPAATNGFNGQQRHFLAAVAAVLERQQEWDEVTLHAAIEAERERLRVSVRDAGIALHVTIYGKLAGRQPAWTLAHIDRALGLGRLRSVSQAASQAA